ncbi:MAG: hypothetical protein ABFE07_29625 [Armatimonadia bacterium]
MAKVRETPVGGSDTPPADDPKTKPEAPKEAKVKVLPPGGKAYILATGPAGTAAELGWAREDHIYDDIRAFALDQNVGIPQVHVYELGREVVVEMTINIKPA